jgi:hypothetical protein
MRQTFTPESFGAVLALVLIAFWAGACSRPAAKGGSAESLAEDHGRLPGGALDQAIAPAIGDPSTCVLVAERGTNKVLYQYGQIFNCVRGLPACDRPGVLTARQALPLATAAAQGRETSCASTPDGSRMVGWAEGPVNGHTPNLVYSAVMEGQQALPGHEIATRLADAFQTAGL